jgi:uncharacterized protein (DUF433 family)
MVGISSMTQAQHELVYVLDNMKKRFSRRTRRLMADAVLALPVAAAALGWADHSHFAPLIWLFSPGLPLALHVHLSGLGFLDGATKLGMFALLINFAYYVALIFAVSSWILGRTARWLELYEEIVARDPDVLGGTPIFRGTRVPFQTFLEYIQAGRTLDDFLDDFPTVTRDAAVRALPLTYRKS